MHETPAYASVATSCMRLGINFGYQDWGTGLANAVTLAQEAERSRLPLGVDRGGLRHGRGHAADVAHGPHREAQLRLGHPPDAGPHPGDDRDDRGHAGSHEWRAVPARPRTLRAAGGRGLARPAVRQAARPHPRVRGHRPHDPEARGTARASRQRVPHPVRRSRRDRPRQAAEDHRASAARGHPDLPRGDRPEERRAVRGDRRRMAADLLLADPAPRHVRRGTRRRLRQGRAARRSPTSTSRRPSA